LIRHVHLHDNLGGQLQADDLHLPVGGGSVDFRAIMTGLMNANYDGTITLEVKPEFQGTARIRVEILVKEIQKMGVCLWT